ncbi:hypothetical protein [Azohydromonas caseinilytica]|uniref:Uncharacterized protein n=1 Tax=Azohydromonas caseinilytica TaxID=2728836 RepID=A0A848FAU1_9BURK|nr:hypothetical protein [Azohydromonas caseinilytica]NML16644.1 hypothetical protein [Azohydromonas caseinilytica]
MGHDDPDRAGACAPRPLAQGAVGQVLWCEHCRQVHLQVGPLTLRLTVEAFEDLAGLAQSARQRLPAPSLPAAPAATAAWH